MCIYPNYYKFFFHNYIKKFLFAKLRMINLSFDELRLIAQLRNISDYENKYNEDLVKALSEPKPETPKLETPKPKTPKTPKPPKPEAKIRMKTDKKLKKLRKDFDELKI